FVGCSAESEASFQTISYLAQKVDATGVSTIFTIENSDQKIAKTIVENTRAKNQKIQALDSMQSVTASDISKGETYLGIMEKNLSVLRGALNE
ncbi:MAG: zinc ABC transporter substrate-binding protein, partial [Eubacterium sp.]